MENRFIDKFIENWKPILVCFGMALIIYVFSVFNDQGQVKVPLDYSVIEDGPMTACTSEKGLKEKVVITVKGKKNQVSSLTMHDFKAYVDISAISQSGHVSVPVLIEAENRPDVMDYVSITVKPERIELDVEEKGETYMDITPVIIGSPAYGYKISGTVRCRPSYAKISGPKRLVDRLENLKTEVVRIDELTNTSVQKVSLEKLSKYLTSDVHSVEVEVPIVPAGMSKSFTGIPVEYKNLQDDLEIINEIYTVDLTLEGEVLTFENFDVAEIKIEADCSKITDSGSFDLPVNIKIPSRVRLDYQSIFSVKIETKKMQVEADDVEDSDDNDNFENEQKNIEVKDRRVEKIESLNLGKNGRTE